MWCGAKKRTLIFLHHILPSGNAVLVNLRYTPPPHKGGLKVWPPEKGALQVLSPHAPGAYLLYVLCVIAIKQDISLWAIMCTWCTDIKESTLTHLMCSGLSQVMDISNVTHIVWEVGHNFN